MRDDQNNIQQKQNEVLRLDQDIKRLQKKRKHGVQLLVGLFVIMMVIAGVPIILQVTAKVPPTVFNEDGKFGIGTLTPSQFLDVRGHGNFSGNLYVDNQTLVNTWLYNQSGSGGTGTVTSVTRGEGFNLSGSSITTTGTLNINYTEAQRRVIGTCAVGSSIRIISETGIVTCETDTTGSGQLDDVYNGTVKALITDGIINITSNDVTQNVTFTLRLTNESSSYTPIKWNYNQSDNSQLLYNYNESSSFWIPIRNASHIINTQISCLNITGNGNDADFCNDASSAGGSYSNAISNLTALINTDNYILINTTGVTNGINNQSLIVNLSFNVIKWLYNHSDNSQLLFNYNLSLASFNQYGTFWYNQSLPLYTLISSNEASWLSTFNITYDNYKTNVSKNWSADAITWTQAQGYSTSGGDNMLNVAFVNNSNLFTLPNNFTFSSGFPSIYAMNWSNVTIFNSQIRNYMNESSSYSPIKFGYNMTTPILSMTNTWLVPQTFTPSSGTSVWTYNSNVTMNANLTFNDKNNGITFNTASRIFDNGSCLIMKRGTGEIALC